MSLETKSAGGIILNKEGHIAIVNQKGHAWSLPKGHVEGQESLLETAKREVLEETGLSELTLISTLTPYTRYKMDKDGNDDHSELKHIHFFLFSTSQNYLSPSDVDNPEARWVTKEEAYTLLTHKKDKAFLKEHFNLISSYEASSLLLVITSTKTKEDAETLGKSLLEKKLIACFQIDGPISSIYRWNDAIECEEEYRCIIKTTQNQFDTIEALLKDTHPYDTPEIIALRITQAEQNFANWVKACTQENAS